MITDHKKNTRKKTKTERNQKVVRLAETEKYNLEQIGKKVGGISRQRVHQILTRAGVDFSSIAKARRRKQQIEKRCKRCDVVFWVQPAKKDQKFCSEDCMYREKTYTKTELLDYAEELQTKHGELTVRILREEAPPSYSTIYNYFGGLNNLKQELEERNEHR